MKTGTLATNPVPGRLKAAFDWLSFSQVHIAVLAIVLAASSGRLAGYHIDTHILVFSGLGASAIYLIDRLFPTRADAINQPERSKWFVSNRATVAAWLAAAVCVGLLIFSALPVATRVVAVLLLVVGCAYILPPGMLRKVTVAKPVIIAAAWSAGIVILPLVHTGVQPATIAALTLYRFAYLLPNCLLSDCNDIKGDRKMSFRTASMILGDRNVLHAILASTTLGLMAAFAAIASGVSTWLLVVDMIGMLFFVRFAFGLIHGSRKSTFVLDLVLFWPVLALVSV